MYICMYIYNLLSPMITYTNTYTNTFIRIHTFTDQYLHIQNVNICNINYIDYKYDYIVTYSLVGGFNASEKY